MRGGEQGAPQSHYGGVFAQVASQSRTGAGHPSAAPLRVGASLGSSLKAAEAQQTEAASRAGGDSRSSHWCSDWRGSKDRPALHYMECSQWGAQSHGEDNGYGTGW